MNLNECVKYLEQEGRLSMISILAIHLKEEVCGEGNKIQTFEIFSFVMCWVLILILVSDTDIQMQIQIGEKLSEFNKLFIKDWLNTF